MGCSRHVGHPHFACQHRLPSSVVSEVPMTHVLEVVLPILSHLLMGVPLPMVLWAVSWGAAAHSTPSLLPPTSPGQSPGVQAMLGMGSGQRFLARPEMGGCRPGWVGTPSGVCPQVVQPDPEEAGGAQGAGEGAHLCGHCSEAAGQPRAAARRIRGGMDMEMQRTVWTQGSREQGWTQDQRAGVDMEQGGHK